MGDAGLHLLQTLGFLLKIVELQYVETHEPIFYGPGFLESWIDMPLIVLTAVTFLGTALFAAMVFLKPATSATWLSWPTVLMSWPSFVLVKWWMNRQSKAMTANVARIVGFPTSLTASTAIVDQDRPRFCGR